VQRYGKAPNFFSGSLGLSSRSLLPHDGERGVEFYEVLLAPHWREECEAHAPGTHENLHVTEGTIEVTVGREAGHVPHKGDTISYPADLKHAYRNLTGEPARLYLIMTYTGPEAHAHTHAHEGPRDPHGPHKGSA